MVVVSRNVDLSIGSVLGLSAYVSAGLFGQHPGIPIPVVFLVGLGIGLACGMANGLMVAVGRVPSLVVTLATLYIIRGIDILIVGGNEVTAQTLPNSFTNIPRATVVGVPYLAIAVAVVIGIGAYYLRSFRSGRELYAIGSNPEAARLAGIPVGRRIFTAFAVSGGIAGVAGVLWAAQYQTIDSTAGTGYELTVISAVVVGGVAIFGGSGSAVGAAVGALLLCSITSALNVLGISQLWLEAISGFLLLLAITLDRVISVRLMAALRRRSARRWNLTRTPRRPARLHAAAPAPRRGSVRWETGLGLLVVAIVIFGAVDLAPVPDQRQLLQHRGHLGRDRDHGAADDADHHQRRDRPVGGLDPGHVQRAARRPVGQHWPMLAIFVWSRCSASWPA